MSVSLFRRWRSQKFADLIGQESVVTTLQNVLVGGSPARAYLFCGPRGTGKTSSARIFAKALNCEQGPATEPCNTCHQCTSISEGSNLDVFEIDAASHTQVDKIRDFIVEKVHFTPVSARYKVYIIDEVHKLSTSSFNALLKTLEEPPSHVVFILATTHPHEMPATILSRCQRYDFRPLSVRETEAHLLNIAREEGIVLEEDAARQLARASDGSLRDALVLFEQATVFAESQAVTRDGVLDLLGVVGYELLDQMLRDLQSGESGPALRRLDDWVQRGRDLKRLAETFLEHLRILLLLKVKAHDQTIDHLSEEERTSIENLADLLSVGAVMDWLKKTMEVLSNIRMGRPARLEWEIFIVSLAQPEVEADLAALSRRLERLEASGDGPRTQSLGSSELEARLSALESRFESLTLPSSQGDPELEARLRALESRLTQERASVLPETSQEPTSVSTVVSIAVDKKEQESLDPLNERPSAADESEQVEPVPATVKPAEESESPPKSEPKTNDLPLVMPEPLITNQSYRALFAPQSPTPEPQVPEPNISKVQDPTAPEAVPEQESQSQSQSGSEPNLQPPEFWRLLMQQVKEQDIRLQAVLADARLTSLDLETFELALPMGYDWHLSKIQEGRELLERVASGLVGSPMRLQSRLGGEKVAAPKESEHDELVQRASGVFGGASIVE